MITVRDATLADAPRLVEIYDYYVRNTAITFEYETPSLEEFEKRMQTVARRFPYLVVEHEGTVAGYAYAGTFKDRAAYDWCCELTIYLDPSCKGVGLGRILYEALEARLFAMGITNMYACIGYPDVDDEYLTSNSIDFHAHLGFKMVGDFKACGCKFGRWYNMAWMEKMLAAHTNNPKSITPYPQILRSS